LLLFRKIWNLKKKPKKNFFYDSKETPENATDFSANNFQPEAYASQLFISKPVLSVKDDKKHLYSLKKEVADELKSNVYKNYQIFMDTSKEIGYLESDISKLRSTLNEVSVLTKDLGSSSIPLSNFSESEFLEIPTRVLDQKTISNLQILLEMSNNLDLCFQLRQFQKAVLLFEDYSKIMKENLQFETLFSNIQLEIQNKQALLTDLLANELKNPTVKSIDTRLIISLMRKLGQSTRAQHIYLETRSAKIEREIKKLKLEGDISLYANDLARLVFSSISLSCDDFRSAFSDSKELISGFVVWSIEELKKFGEVLKKNLNADDFLTIGKCLEISRVNCRMLEEKGLSLTYFVFQMLQPEIMKSITKYYKNIEANLIKHTSKEQWHGSSVPNSITNSKSKMDIQLTESAVYLFKISHDFVDKLCVIITSELIPIIISSLSNLFENYLVQLIEHFSDELTDNQGLSLISNSGSIIEILVPDVVSQFQTKFQKANKDFEKMKSFSKKI